MGNLDAKRDWGHAKDFVEAQWLMLQAPKPIDYVIATGQQYSVREFINAVTQRLGLSIDWRGTGTEEVGVLTNTENMLCSHLLNKIIIRVDKKYFRPAEVSSLLGDSTKARRELGWSPRITFDQLVDEMTAKDLEIAYLSLNK
jgi:GDPmannose 4,6-dehydratase